MFFLRHTYSSYSCPSPLPHFPKAIWTTFLFLVSVRGPSFASCPLSRHFSHLSSGPWILRVYNDVSAWEWSSGSSQARSEILGLLLLRWQICFILLANLLSHWEWLSRTLPWKEFWDCCQGTGWQSWPGLVNVKWWLPGRDLGYWKEHAQYLESKEQWLYLSWKPYALD